MDFRYDILFSIATTWNFTGSQQVIRTAFPEAKHISKLLKIHSVRILFEHLLVHSYIRTLDSIINSSLSFIFVP